MIAHELQSLVDRMPEPDSRGILSNVDRDAVLRALGEIHAAGKESIAALVEKLVEPGKGDDNKARYALHGLALYVCGLGNRPHNNDERQAFAKALAATLDTDRPSAVKEFVLRELQVCGGREVVESIGKHLAEPALSDAAAAALVAIGGDTAAVEFRRLLSSAQGRMRLIAVQNLGVLRDKQSVDALTKATTDADAEVRTAACWALANIGDSAGIDACLKAAEKATGYERIQAGKNRLLLAERLRDAGRKADAQHVYGHVRITSGDQSEAYLREIAERALATLG
jgi:HEAT repeat protein